MSILDNRSARVAGSWTSLVAIGGFWIASDLGYYFWLPAIGRGEGYNEDPIAISIYYLFWVGLAVISFWPVYATWSLYAEWPTFRNRLVSAAIWCVVLGSGVAFAAYGVPALSPGYWPESWGPAPDILLATEKYFLPKSLEILFQQLLMVALVLTLSAFRMRLWSVSIYSAAMFGAMHLLLALGDMPWGAVARFTVFSSLFGLLVPTLILRVPNGVALAYALQWGFYAVTILMARTFGPGAA